MGWRSVWRAQRAALLSAILVGYVPAFLVLCMLVVARLRFGIPVENLTRDPAAVAGAPFYIGVVSNFGMVLWGASAAACFLGYMLLRGDAGKRDLRLFFLVSGMITCALLLDDLLQFHEEIYPKYVAIPQRFTYGAYTIGLLAYVARFRAAISRTPYLLALLAAVFLGLSAVADQLPFELPAHYLFEDGFKLLGIVGWLTYLARSVLEQAAGRVRSEWVAKV